MLKKIFSHTAIYGLTPYVPQIANIFILPIITKDLTDLDFGVLGIVMAYNGLLTVLATLGLRVVIGNTFYKHQHRYKIFWRQIYGFLNLWVIIYGVLQGALLYLIVPSEAAANRLEIVLLNTLPVMLFGPADVLGSTFYRLNENPWPIGLRTAFIGLLTVSLNLYTISYLKMGYMGWFWSTFISTMLLQISYWYPLNIKAGIRPIYNFKWRYIIRSIKISLPTVPHYYSGYLLNNSDRLVMDLLGVTTGNIGRYNIAYKFGNYVQSAGMAFNKAIGPMLMLQYSEGNDKRARDIVFLVQACFLAGTFVVCIWLKEIFWLLIKNDTLAAMYPLGIIILMSYNYRPMYIGANQKLFYTEQTNLLWKISFVAGASNVLLNVLVIPLLGFQAAAFTTFASLMYMGYSGYFTQTFKEVNNASYYPLYWLTGTIFLTAIAYAIQEVDPLLKCVVTLGVVLVFCGVTYTTGLLKLKDD